MSLVDVASVKEHTTFDPLPVREKIVKFGSQAEDRMRSALSDDRYDEIVDKGRDDDDWQRLQKAETLWATSEALVMLNLHSDEDGGFVSSTGFQGTAGTAYLSKGEIDDYRASLQDQALTVIAPLKTNLEADPTWVL
jgi:hypothetical protein